jgi:hypothetical protein
MRAAVEPHHLSNPNIMRSHLLIFNCMFFALLCACDKSKKSDSVTEQQEALQKIITEVKETGSAELIKSDTPLLPVSEGDTWNYTVTLQVPENAQSKGSPMISQSFERKRTYIGKVKPSGDRDATDCFEIEATGSPVEREFVEIENESVKMRGSEIVGVKEALPLWMEPAVLLVRAGVMTGESLPPIQIKDPRTGAEVTRHIQIVGRETVKLAGREFATIRILMSGKDGKENPIELRRTIWFAPHYGIVKEEKSRYVDDGLMMKETIELKSMKMKNDPEAVKEP